MYGWVNGWNHLTVNQACKKRAGSNPAPCTNFMKKKRCSKCKETLSISQFSFRVKSKGTLIEKCKSCVSIYGKSHYHRNRQQYRDRCKKTRKKRTIINRQRWVRFLLDHPCVFCNESDIRCLDFDHIDPKTKKYSISRMLSIGVTWNVILVEIKKCRVLCANCHRKRTSKQFGYFKETAISSVEERWAYTS